LVVVRRVLRLFCSCALPPSLPTLFPYTTLFRSLASCATGGRTRRGDPPRHRQISGTGTGRTSPLHAARFPRGSAGPGGSVWRPQDRKSTRLNSSHVKISYAVFCLKKKKQINDSMPWWLYNHIYEVAPTPQTTTPSIQVSLTHTENLTFDETNSRLLPNSDIAEMHA